MYIYLAGYSHQTHIFAKMSDQKTYLADLYFEYSIYNGKK